jgi:hypothetical protein
MRCTSVVIADHHPVVASKLLHPAVTVRAASKRFHTGDNSAGNGGDGYFAGTLIDRSYAAFEPLNMAQGAPTRQRTLIRRTSGFLIRRRPR